MVTIAIFMAIETIKDIGINERPVRFLIPINKKTIESKSNG